VAAQYYYCTQCHKKISTFQRLFDALYEFSKSDPENCPVCGSVRELHVSLDFQLGVGDGDFKVVHAFLPEKLESWLGEEEEEVTYYPFLVVLQGAQESKQFYWMPYWHVVGKDARYGQHALCLDHTQFESLVAQAQKKMLAIA
jgi:DNA-directed RNA polymerase subunit RPC12/RpoP